MKQHKLMPVRMNSFDLQALPWPEVQKQLDQKGHALIPGLIDAAICDYWIGEYEAEGIYRKTVVMERHRFGKGEYKYFAYPLPNEIDELRSAIYPFLAPIANRWMCMLNIDESFPSDHQSFVQHCHRQGQQKPTPLILKYGVGGFNTLHQDLYGPVYFPLQLVIFLSDNKAYEGGEFVMTEQIPRTQSKAMVTRPSKGDAMVFATSFRPVKGQRGYYRANLRHGVSEVTSGDRFTLGIIFHDALS